MKTIKGPAIFLAQFAGDKAPFDTLDNICKWAADLGYSVVEFRQYLDVAGVVSTFHCVATIVWKRKHKVWREARWHVSVLSSDVRT